MYVTLEAARPRVAKHNHNSLWDYHLGREGGMKMTLAAETYDRTKNLYVFV